jgi:1-acyl-sn-glycerol-3-phosphate acyltransferase
VAGGIWFFVCSAVGLLALLLTGRRRDPVFHFARAFCGGVAGAMGWTIDVDDRRLSASRPCVFVSNHQSIMDVLVFGAVVPRRTVAVGKRELAKIPLFGWFFVRSGNLVIERGNSDAAREMLAAAGRRVNDEKLSVWFMPEGHRNSGAALLPFKRGAFRLAAAAGVPVVPVVAAPLTSLVDTRRLLAHRGRLSISVLEAVMLPAGAGETDIERAANEVRSSMQKELERLTAAAPRAGH